MVRRVRTIRRLVLDLPGQVRLAYCLTRDPRTPRPLKLLAGAAVALILTPAVNIPLWVPVLGQMDAVALLVLCLRRFNGMAPPTVRAELEERLRTGTSAFDQDLASGGRVARELARWVGERARAPFGRRPAPRAEPSLADPSGWDRRPAPAGPSPVPPAPTSPPHAGPGAPSAPVDGTTTGDDRGGDQP
ncbi:MAG TPA: hypothetical protein VNN74_03055 [Candidatus Micrarchaeia archaeon]|nr:hypothetical protein [Candidatus Micrarchaeia archaeon]